MDVYINKKRVRLDPAMSIGKGGEADVFGIGQQAIKIFKPPNHPDFKGSPLEQRAAKERIKEHQKKLPAFPLGLPDRVIVPQQLAYDRTGKKIVGYSMRFLQNAEVLLRYADRKFRQAGIGNDLILKIFLDLFASVQKVHQAGVIIGDFNDLNVMVVGNQAYLIDADSYQFKKFFCRLFTARFADPLRCDPQNNSLLLSQPHNENSDWYAFNIMLFQCLLYVDPYGGIYKPKNKRKKINHDARPLHRITVFHPEVKYPKPAVPYDVLPDDLLDHFHKVFEKDVRGIFPIDILQNFTWTKCTVCAKEHARAVCPHCALPAPVKEAISIHGQVTATRFFRTKGLILHAAYQGSRLRWVYHEHGKFKREEDTIITPGQPDPGMRFRIQGRQTIIGKKEQALVFTPGQPSPDRLVVDNFGTLPIFDTNANRKFWIYNGHLMADGKLGPDFPEQIGEVLTNQTLFWAGPKFGFGFYRAGNLSVAFVFDAKRRGINDTVKMPSIRGQLIDATCIFSQHYCWFFIATQESGKIIHQCYVIGPDGLIKAATQAEKNDDSWLGVLRGKCSAGDLLLAATDEGVVRVELQGDRLIETQKFPDTESFVHAGKHLFAGKDGLYVVGSRDITVLKIR